MKLLEQLIIAVNYSGLLETDIDEIVKSTRIFFLEQGFHISEGIHKNINLQLNDPETLEGTLVSNAEMIRKYVYSRENITINITKES